MHGILHALKKSGLFSKIDILDFVDEETVKILKIRGAVLDGTLLFITELHTSDYQKYSYHWQKQNGEMIMRWDNKPHWKHLKTHPHHKHIKNEVMPCSRPDIAEIIEEIRKHINEMRV